MVTITKIGEEYNSQILEISGLSTDPKPVDKIDGVSIANGSKFKEIDTGKEYTYNESAEIWHVNKTASSSGGSGLDGEDGITPHIGENGNWFIGTVDTGVPAQGPAGENGVTPHIGTNGNWYIGSTNTGVSAKGVKGDKGDTGAQGEPGKDGSDGKDGISATHSWNGTVLSITSASGTSSVDLKGEKGDTGAKGDVGSQGEKGDPGATGPKGDTGAKGDNGADGGHYTPIVTQPTSDTMQISFTPSKSDMPAVNPVTVNLPVSEGSGENVNPVAKTEDMTQPVGVDENGLLWTAPTDGGTDSDGDTREEIVGVTPFEVLETGLYIRPEADTRLYSATDGLENLMEQFQTVETDATKINYGVATNTLIEAQSIVEGQTPVTIAHIYGYSAEPGEYTLLVKSTTKTFIRVMKRTNSNNLGMAPGTNLTSGYTNSVVNFTVTEEDVATHLCNIGVKITATGMVLPDTFSIKLVKGKFDAMPEGVSLEFQVAAGQKFPLDAFQGIIAYSDPVTNVHRTITTEGDGAAEPTSGMLLCFGDSLTATKYSMYPEMLTERGMNAINFGVSGMTLRPGTSPYTMCAIVDALKAGDLTAQIEGGQNANYANLLSLMPTATGIVVWYGTNDYNGDCAFEGDGTDSIEGALRYVLTELFSLCPKKAIYVVSPFMYTYAYGHQPENPNGTVAEMIQVMRGVCEEFAVPFIDMSRESGFNQITRLTLTSDQLHPDTQAGRERLAAFLYGKLRSLGC